MYKPEIRYKANGMPVVSNKELDTIGERLALDFDHTVCFEPHPLDIDRFVERYLGLHLDYMYLSHCGVYLGTMVFQTTDHLPVYIPEDKAADYAHVDAGTVIIDCTLDDEDQEHRYRFTVGHEGSHSILHTNYFLNSIGSSDRDDTGIYIRCRSDFTMGSMDTAVRVMSDVQRVEQQANRLSAAILMPQNAVRILLARNPYNGRKQWVQDAVNKMQETFNVSAQAALIRLQDLDIVSRSVTL